MSRRDRQAPGPKPIWCNACKAHVYPPCLACQVRGLPKQRDRNIDKLAGTIGIAELRLDEQVVTILESAGYVYLEDLEGVDIENLHVSQLGPKRKAALRKALDGRRRDGAGQLAAKLSKGPVGKVK